jgi:hypothetical protein
LHGAFHSDLKRSGQCDAQLDGGPNEVWVHVRGLIVTASNMIGGNMDDR